MYRKLKKYTFDFNQRIVFVKRIFSARVNNLTESNKSKLTNHITVHQPIYTDENPIFL